jgi:hypothetical protein
MEGMVEGGWYRGGMEWGDGVGDGRGGMEEGGWYRGDGTGGMEWKRGMVEGGS